MLMPVEEALARVLSSAKKTASVSVALTDADGMALADDLVSTRSQPPFPASAMDGYAVRFEDLALGKSLHVIGEAAAGHGYVGTVGGHEAVRIFTGAPMPTGSDTVLIQEDAAVDGTSIAPTEIPERGLFVRPEGFDFLSGQTLLKAGERLDFRTLSLAAAMNNPTVEVHRKPIVAIISSGDELIAPGGEPNENQIIASNAFGVASLVKAVGGVPLDLGIVADDAERISAVFDRAMAADADIIVTLGGASVGDHDLIRQVLIDKNATLDFWKIAMRPGKPFMFGALGETSVLGMPGNPVSSLVCTLLFLQPLVKAMQGMDPSYRTERANLATSIGKNGPRQGYLRAHAERIGTDLQVTPFENQDSSLLSVLAQANALLIRPPHAKPAEKGTLVDIIWI